MKWLYVLLVGCGYASAVHGASFSAITDKTEVTLGQSLTLTLRADDVASSLKQLPVDILKQDFAIVATDTQERAKSQFMSLRLHPLKTGLITLPSLSFAGLRSKALNLLVHEFSDDISNVIVKTGFASTNFVEREAVYFYIDVYDDGGLRWRPPQVPVTPDVHIRALPPLEAIRNSDGTVKQRYAYALMPLRSGTINISWPLLEASKFGEPLRYAIPSVVLDVTAIPRYLPLHVPVGKVMVTAHHAIARVKINQPFSWEFVIQGTGFSEEALAKLLEFPENSTLKIYPAQIEIQEGGNTVLQTAKFTVPVVALKSGLVNLPKIAVPYYDPQLGRIASAPVPGRVVRVFNPLTQWLWWIAAGLMVCLTLGLILWKAVGNGRRVLAERAWLKQLASTQDVISLRHALLAPHHKGSLKQWLERYQKQFGDNAALRHQIERLEHMSFSPSPRDNFFELRQVLIATLRKRPKKTGAIRPVSPDLFELIKPPLSS